MRPLFFIRSAFLVAGLGLTVASSSAAPPENKGSAARKPVPSDKVEPKLGLPRFEPKVSPPTPKVETKPPVLRPRFEPPLRTVPPAVEPKPSPRPGLPILPKPGSGPLKPIDLKPELKPTRPPEVKLPIKTEPRPVLIHEKTKTGPIVAPKGPGLKLPGGTKFDQAELAKIKPPVDLTKVKPATVLGGKPPSDFKVKPIKLDQIHVPQDAVKVSKLNMANVQANQKFVMNTNFYMGGDYHTKFGVKTAAGFFCYAGKHHCHWHHCVWDPCFGCHYYFCPSASCYYYWCEPAHCYYPCHWFVDYGTCYYPWWICGGFGGYGYVGAPHISIFIGW